MSKFNMVILMLIVSGFSRRLFSYLQLRDAIETGEWEAYDARLTRQKDFLDDLLEKMTGSSK